MRPLRNVEDVGGQNLTGKQSLAAVEALWNEWEIHCLILVSLALQTFLFVTAGMRKRSTSLVLRTVLWLAYLSADSVAIFVLGHLAVHASGLRHQLLLFWAPFVLVHLGGQDTITALSVQDNELWTRHLLGLVSQVAVAGYVVSKSSWPDGRLRAAMVLMFLSGSFKYAGRTLCLFSARPANLRAESLFTLEWKHEVLQQAAQGGGLQAWICCGATREDACQELRRRFDLMLNGDRSQESLLDDNQIIEIMTVDAPLNREESVVGRDDLPSMLEMFSRSIYRCGAYDYVGEQLVNCYERLYTKRPLLKACYLALLDTRFWGNTINRLILVATLFQYLSTPVALVLFRFAEKAGQLHSRADVTVSYVLLVGAIMLDVSSAFMSTFFVVRSRNFPDGRIKSATLRVANYIQAAAGSRKQWSENLAQYRMIKRYAMLDTAGMSSVQQWIGKRLNACGVELLDPSLTHTPITDDLKKFVLDKLLAFGTGKQPDWNCASSRGQLALRRMDGAETALHKNINGVDFPTSVLIWHIATDICFYFEYNSRNISDQMKRSRELSNYIMYLVFKCGVMLTSHSQLVHSKVHEELMEIFQVNLREKEAVMKVFGDKKDEQSASTVTKTKKHEESANTDSAISSQLQELLQSTAESIYSPVLPRAREVAQELIGIDNKADRWELIAAVWLEMLYYTAPRCGGAFHYQYLSTGGEFITHVLVLMYFLGPFLPTPGA